MFPAKHQDKAPAGLLWPFLLPGRGVSRETPRQSTCRIHFFYARVSRRGDREEKEGGERSEQKREKGEKKGERRDERGERQEGNGREKRERTERREGGKERRGGGWHKGVVLNGNVSCHFLDVFL